MHAVLLGDSVFDNAIYVPGDQTVINQVNSRLSQNDLATLLAADGSMTTDVVAQLPAIPHDATHLFVSCGGNDALNYVSILPQPAQSIKEVLSVFSAIRTEFQLTYRAMLKQVLATGLPVTLCTVYDGIPTLTPAARTALSMFNEMILREAVAMHINIIDLRLLCTEKSDFSAISPVEPSATGGHKIAAVIANICKEIPGVCQIYR